MKIHIKYMVSFRCKIMVEEELKKLGLHAFNVDLGEVEILEEITPEQYEEFRTALSKLGLELMDDAKDILVERIKRVVIEMIHFADKYPRVNYSTHISRKLGYNYTYLANIFSKVKGMPIRKYIIIHKIEKVKELLSYEELSLTEICFQLHYSGVGHLSNQFKKITGLSPTLYKQLNERRTVNLESL